MSTQDPITLACRILRDAAYDLLVNHTPHRARGDWTGEEDAKESYDEHIAAADALERWAASIGAGGVEPLTDEQIVGVMHSIPINAAPSHHIAFARAIEQAHGIDIKKGDRNGLKT